MELNRKAETNEDTLKSSQVEKHDPKKLFAKSRSVVSQNIQSILEHINTKDDLENSIEPAKKVEEKEGVEGGNMERLFHVKENYEAQTNHYRELGWLKERNGKEGIQDKEGNFYPMPTLQEVRSELNKKAALLEYKETQSFKRFLLVPFGLSYVEMYKKLGKEYKRYQEDPDLGLYRTDADKTKITKSINDTWFSEDEEMEEEDLLYYEEHREKSELIQTQTFPAWEIHIVPEKMTLPREGQGETIGDRPEIESDMRFGNYKKLLKGEFNHPDGKPIRDAEGLLVYRGETGLTPEIEVALAFVQLRENKQVLHDNENNPNDAACALIECLTKYESIPVSHFSHDRAQVYLNVADLVDWSVDGGALSSVKVC